MIDIFVPNSVELSSTNVADNLHHLRQNGIRFPFICKPLLAHGSKDAHDVIIAKKLMMFTCCFV